MQMRSKLQQKLKSVLADGSTSFAASADKLRKETLAEYATTFQRDVRLPGFPWDGQVRSAVIRKSHRRQGAHQRVIAFQMPC
eukprot:350048-Chlamydomonas_euryale.AAC.5